MKFIYNRIRYVFRLYENTSQILVIENKEELKMFLSNLIEHLEGKNDFFIFSDEADNIIDSKTIEFVTDCIGFDLNTKKVTTKLNNVINNISNEDGMYVETCDVINSINSYYETLKYTLDFDCEYKEMDSKELIKAGKFKFNSESILFEKILDFIKINSILNIAKIIIFNNMKLYFDKEELDEIYKCAFYNKIQIVDIEAVEPIEHLDCESFFIWDKDLCELYSE